MKLDLLLAAETDRDKANIGHYLAHLKALDSGDLDAAASHLNLALEHFAGSPGRSLPPAYALMTASFEARFGRGTAVAWEWLDLFQTGDYNALAVEIEQLFWQTKAGIWFQEGSWGQAHAAAKRSLALLPQTIDAGHAAAAQEWLAYILQETADAAQTVDFSAEWKLSNRLRPLLPVLVRSLVMLTLLVLVGVGIGLLWENGR